MNEDKFIQPDDGIVIVSRKEKSTEEKLVELLAAALASGDSEKVMKILELKEKPS